MKSTRYTKAIEKFHKRNDTNLYVRVRYISEGHITDYDMLESYYRAMVDSAKWKRLFKNAIMTNFEVYEKEAE